MQYPSAYWQNAYESVSAYQLAAEQPAPASSLSSGLIHYWPLEEESSTRVDVIGASEITVIAGSAPGKHLSGLLFPAPDVQEGSGPIGPFDATTQDLTVSCWMKRSSVDFFVASVSIAPGGGGVILNITSNGSYMLLSGGDQGGNGGPDVISSNDFLEWAHAVAVFDHVQVQSSFFVNGALVGVLTYTGPDFEDPYNTIYIGGGYGAESGGDQIDEIALWNRKLTLPEIAELYNSGAGRFYPF